MIIKISDGKYQSYEVDVKFETKEVHSKEIEYFGDQKITSPTKTLKIIGWNYDTTAFTLKEQTEIEMHIKEYLLDIEDLLN